MVYQTRRGINDTLRVTALITSTLLDALVRFLIHPAIFVSLNVTLRYPYIFRFVDRCAVPWFLRGLFVCYPPLSNNGATQFVRQPNSDFLPVIRARIEHGLGRTWFNFCRLFHVAKKVRLMRSSLQMCVDDNSLGRLCLARRERVGSHLGCSPGRKLGALFSAPSHKLVQCGERNVADWLESGA